MAEKVTIGNCTLYHGDCREVLIDALKGISYEDDKQVWRIVAERKEPDGEARVVVGMHEMPARETAQAGLFAAQAA